jgi:peptidoglycan/LPS O-acetylase OafA/YrhL
MAYRISDETSRLFDVLRGVAALLVVLGHSRQHAAEIFDLNRTGSTLLEKIILIPSSFAMESVAVFFVLSGFLVGGQTIKLMRNDQFLWLDFLAKRLSRLWTVLIPGIIFTWVMWELNNTITGYSSNVPLVEEAVCNFLFLQEALCDPFLNNASLWSLSYEFWFYIIFAGAAVGISQVFEKRYYSSITSIAIISFCVWLFGINLLLLIPAWLIGVVVAWISIEFDMSSYKIMSKSYFYVFLSVILITIFSVASGFMGLDRNYLTVFVAIPAALFIYSSLFVKSEPKLFRVLINIGVFIGQKSFSIYVFHLPIAIFILNTFNFTSLVGNLTLPELTYLTFIICVPFTMIMWWLTERHTATVRTLFLRFTRQVNSILGSNKKIKQKA